MYCPHCSEDRRDGLTRCPVCQVLLVPDASTPNRAAELFPKVVGVLDTNDNFALASACTSLDQAGIVFDVVPVSDVSAALKSPEAKWWIPPSRILVSDEDEAEARELLAPFQEPITSDVNEQEASGRDGRREAGVLERLFMPYQNPVQRLGCSLLFAGPALAGLVILISSRRDGSLVGIYAAWTLIAVSIAGIVRSWR